MAISGTNVAKIGPVQNIATRPCDIGAVGPHGETSGQAMVVAIDGTVTATIDETTLATSAKQDTQITAEQAILAKLPAVGTAGTPSTNVISVQGVTSGTPVIIGGLVASGAADSGNPIKTAGVYSTASTITAQTAGNRVDTQTDSVGNTRIIIAGNGLAPFATATLAGYGLTRNSNSVTSAQALALATMGGFWNGTNIIPAPGDASGGVNQPYAITSSRWLYAAATGGIVNTTTAVTVAAAAGASVRNYVASMQIHWDALGVATEIAVRDGAGGTVLWRGKIPAGAAGMEEIIFPSPLKGTANTLMEVVTLTASVTGGTFFNLQGFTGA